MVLNSSRTGPKLENTNLLVLHSSSPVEFFKLFITVQRGAPGSFKPLSDGVINLYLYIRQWEKARDKFWMFYITLAINSVLLTSMQILRTLKNLKSEKRLIMR